jgi:hypothetical protein
MYPHARDLGDSWHLGVSTFLPVITEDGYHGVMVGFSPYSRARSPHSRARSPGHDANGRACLCDVHRIALIKIPVRIDADVLLQLSWRGVASSPGVPSSRPAVAAKRKRQGAKIRQEIVLAATPLRRHWLADPFRLGPRCIRTHAILAILGTLAFQLSCLSSPKTVIMGSWSGLAPTHVLARPVMTRTERPASATFTGLP